MFTPIDSMLNSIAAEHYQKSWHQLDNNQKTELRGYVAKFDDDHFSYVKPRAGYFSNYAVEGADKAASKTTRYIENFTREYSDFAQEVGISLSLPCRKIKAQCPISELADWKLELEKWASEHHGEALELAKDTCRVLNSTTVDMKVVGTNAEPKMLEALQQSVERKVFKAVAAGCKAFGASAGVAQYLVRQAEHFKGKVIESDSTFHARNIYLNAAKKAEKLAAVLDGIGASLDMKQYAEVLEVMSDIERSTPGNEVIAGLDDSTKEHDAFEKFSTNVKELVACFPAGEEGVAQARKLVSSCLDPMNDKVRVKLHGVCERCLNAQRQAEQRSKRTIPTGITGILDELARRHDVDQRLGKTDPKSRDYESQSKITGFQDLPEEMRKTLLKKAASLYREDEKSPAVYSSDNVGLGWKAVAGADTLAASVQRRVGDAIDGINELAAAAGMEARIETLGKTSRYLVSELVGLQKNLNAWAQENPHVMDLTELEGELSQLARRKSSNSDAVEQIGVAVDACLEKMVIACVNGGGNPARLLAHMNTKAQSLRWSASVSAQATCDSIINKTGMMAASAHALQEMQTAQPALVPKLTGEQVVAVVKDLKPLADYCVDDSTSIKLDSDKFDELYFDAALALTKVGVEFKAIPDILRQYTPGRLTNPGTRMGELEKCMVHLNGSTDVAEDKVHAARKFSSVLKSVQNCSTGGKIDYDQLDEAITDGLTACVASGMNMDQSVQLLKAVLSGSSLVATARLQEYLEISEAITRSFKDQRKIEPETICKIVQSLDTVKVLKDFGVADASEKFDRAYCQAFHEVGLTGLSSEQVAGLIHSQLTETAGTQLNGMLKEMASIQQFLPARQPITVEYVKMARHCCGHLGVLKKAGTSIENIEVAVDAINGIVIAVVEHPECADLSSVMANLEKWIVREAKAGKGSLFQPVSAGGLTGFLRSADRYDEKLKVVMNQALELCEDFEANIAEHTNGASVSDFNIQKWARKKQLSGALEKAYAHRALQSPDIAVVEMPDKYKSVVNATLNPVVDAVDKPLGKKGGDNNDEPVAAPPSPPSVNVPPPPPPPPPPVNVPPPPPPPPPEAVKEALRLQTETNAQKEAAPPKNIKAEPVSEERGKLMEAIRSGKKLNKIPDEENGYLKREKEKGKKHREDQTGITGALHKALESRKDAIADTDDEDSNVSDNDDWGDDK